MRVCNARYVSALVIAITACSAKVLQQLDLAVGEAAASGAVSDDRTDRRAVPHQRHRDMTTGDRAVTNSLQKSWVRRPASRIWMIRRSRIARQRSIRASAASETGAS